MNLLSTLDLTKEQMFDIFNIADELKVGKTALSLKEETVMALLFQKPSTRTRVSFEAAMAQLGGHAIYIDAMTTQLSRGETMADTARVLGSYVDFIVARLFKHEDLVEIANNTDAIVINALTDIEHPCQALSDLYTIREAKKKARGIRLAFVGDVADNVLNSLMVSATKLGVEMVLVGPKSYPPNAKYYAKAREYGKVELIADLKEGLQGADVVYTDTFVSMGQEKEAEKRKKLFAPFQISAKSMEYAEKGAIFMHCLPAHRGEEVTAEVLDGPQSVVWQQAKNKLLVEKAILLYLLEQSI